MKCSQFKSTRHLFRKVGGNFFDVLKLVNEFFLISAGYCSERVVKPVLSVCSEQAKCYHPSLEEEEEKSSEFEI